MIEEMMDGQSTGHPKATPPIVVRLQAQFAELPPALARVAKHVINYPLETTALSIEALSRVTESGQASIVRLVHNLGFESFRSFKLALAAQCGGAPAVDPAAQTVDAVERLRWEMAESLDRTGVLLDRAALDQVARAIALARHVNIYGGGVSAMVGEILSAKLLRAGIWAVSYADANLGLEVVGPVSRQAVAIAISDSGTTMETVRLLRAARASGARTVAITSWPTSPLATHADILLVTSPIAQPPSPGFVTTLVAQIFVIQALVEAIGAGAPEPAGHEVAAKPGTAALSREYPKVARRDPRR
jgi:DNA-binding MurR/RpiR family transcriptional regulator